MINYITKPNLLAELNALLRPEQEARVISASVKLHYSSSDGYWSTSTRTREACRRQACSWLRRTSLSVRWTNLDRRWTHFQLNTPVCGSLSSTYLSWCLSRHRILLPFSPLEHRRSWPSSTSSAMHTSSSAWRGHTQNRHSTMTLMKSIHHLYAWRIFLTIFAWYSSLM